ncbi:conjugal transfer protein TraH, partial [Mesorhizobium sp. M7A.F.Ca.MR.176.00.0.0]
MVDAAFIQQCADRALKPAIVETFIERAGSQDPLAVTVRSGNRVVLVPKPATPDEALALIRQHVGRNVVRVGITQYPAGLGVVDAGELKPDLVDACANIRMGTALFAKVYRIVTKWYGNP